MSASTSLTWRALIYTEHVSQKSEENLAVAETELEKSTNMVAEMTRRNDELQGLAEEASRLKDQVDE